MSTGKELVRYLKSLRRITTLNYAEREVHYARHKKVHAIAVENNYIVKASRYLVNSSHKKDVWLLTTGGSTFLRQLRGDFRPPDKLDWL